MLTRLLFVCQGLPHSLVHLSEKLMLCDCNQVLLYASRETTDNVQLSCRQAYLMHPAFRRNTMLLYHRLCNLSHVGPTMLHRRCESSCSCSQYLYHLNSTFQLASTGCTVCTPLGAGGLLLGWSGPTSHVSHGRQVKSAGSPARLSHRFRGCIERLDNATEHMHAVEVLSQHPVTYNADSSAQPHGQLKLIDIRTLPAVGACRGLCCRSR
jgi:hypothetical protein